MQTSLRGKLAQRYLRPLVSTSPTPPLPAHPQERLRRLPPDQRAKEVERKQKILVSCEAASTQLPARPRH